MSICLVYRSSYSSENNTEHLCNLFKSLPSTINMIIGDLNLPNIDWELGTSDKKEVILYQHDKRTFIPNYFPAHIRGNTLDLAFKPMSCGGDDLINDYKSADNAGSQQFFANFNWTAEFEGINTEEAWDLFKSVL